MQQVLLHLFCWSFFCKNPFSNTYNISSTKNNKVGNVCFLLRDAL